MPFYARSNPFTFACFTTCFQTIPDYVEGIIWKVFIAFSANLAHLVPALYFPFHMVTSVRFPFGYVMM